MSYKSKIMNKIASEETIAHWAKDAGFSRFLSSPAMTRESADPAMRYYNVPGNEYIAAQKRIFEALINMDNLVRKYN